MKQVGSVLVMLHNDAGEPTGIVIGLRKDAKKWTLPGGHLNEGEDPKTGALRELREEANFSPAPVNVKFLGSKEVDCADNQKRCIHAFQTMIHESKIGEFSPENDPDKEVHEWKHVPLKNNCIPYDVFDNLYSKPNICLLYAGIGPDKKEVTVPDQKDIQGADFTLKLNKSSSSKLSDGTETHSWRILNKSGKHGNVIIKSIPSGPAVLVKSDGSITPVKKHKHFLKLMDVSPEMTDKTNDILKSLFSKYKNLYVERDGKSSKVADSFKLNKSLSSLVTKLHSQTLTFKDGCYLKKHQTSDAGVISDSWNMYAASGQNLGSITVWSRVGCKEVVTFAPKLNRDNWDKAAKALRKFYSMSDSDAAAFMLKRTETLEKSLACFPARDSLKSLMYLRKLKQLLENLKENNNVAVDMSPQKPTGQLSKFQRKWFHVLMSTQDTAKVKLTVAEVEDYEKDRAELVSVIQGNLPDEYIPPQVDVLAEIV